MCYTTVKDGKENLTRFQRKVYNYIVERTLEDTVPPTVREIASGVNLSTSNVHHHIGKLVERGVLMKDINRRGYRVSGLSVQIDEDAPIYFTEGTKSETGVEGN